MGVNDDTTLPPFTTAVVGMIALLLPSVLTNRSRSDAPTAGPAPLDDELTHGDRGRSDRHSAAPDDDATEASGHDVHVVDKATLYVFAGHAGGTSVITPGGHALPAGHGFANGDGDCGLQ